MRFGAGSQFMSHASFLLVLAFAGVPACAHVPKRNPLPEAAVDLAGVLGIPRARYWGDEPQPWAPEWLGESKSELKGRYPAVFRHRQNFLAISGGGQNGAFAAGLLLGWTAAGDRPEFTTVTGVSAGALIAPFAFLGPEYDHVLSKVSVELTANDIFKKRRLIRGLRSDGMASTAPLQALIAKHIDQDLVDEIAEQHRRGRELNIGTANLDSMRPVVWRIGVIANSGHPQALKLIRQILLASASVPGAFPPVLIEVEAEGETYDEMHVDGGTASQVFLYPLGLDFDQVLDMLEVPAAPKVYIIRNARLDPLYEQVRPKTVQIADRSISSVIRTQGIGDLYRIYLATLRDGLDFNLAYIPKEFTERSKEGVDPEYMRKLFELAFDIAKNGYPWRKMPPELKQAPIRQH
ncbi:MAG: patatin-like phospholipase family protein [Myxococcales bacterium]|nr:patatin-like phospholipase family protein [Myxococcales bacterium]MDH3484765.1 patatin-like phospholipase family protein [Myxococcales bacterium]